MENSRKKQFRTFKLHTILSNVMKSCIVLLCPTWDPQPLTSLWLDDLGSLEADNTSSDDTSTVV